MVLRNFFYSYDFVVVLWAHMRENNFKGGSVMFNMIQKDGVGARCKRGVKFGLRVPEREGAG
jgi:hypothetical protein